MSADEVLIFTRGHPAIRTRRLKYHQQDFFQRRAAIPAPEQSDRITAPPAEQKKEGNTPSEASMNGQPPGPAGKELDIPQLRREPESKVKKELV